MLFFRLFIYVILGAKIKLNSISLCSGDDKNIGVSFANFILHSVNRFINLNLCK